MNHLNWRENAFFQEVLVIVRQAWAAAKSAPPIFGAIAGLVLMFVFGLVLPLILHIFFGESKGFIGAILEFLSGIVSAMSQIFGFVAGLLCWGAATRNFAAKLRAQVNTPVAEDTEPRT